MPYSRGIMQCCDPSVCLSVRLSACLQYYTLPCHTYTTHFIAIITNSLIENPKAVIQTHGSAWPFHPLKVAEAATNPSPTSIQKHSLGGCTIDMPLPPLNCH